MRGAAGAHVESQPPPPHHHHHRRQHKRAQGWHHRCVLQHSPGINLHLHKSSINFLDMEHINRHSIIPAAAPSEIIHVFRDLTGDNQRNIILKWPTCRFWSLHRQKASSESCYVCRRQQSGHWIDKIVSVQNHNLIHSNNFIFPPSDFGESPNLSLAISNNSQRK